MHYLLITLGSHGDVHPFVGIAQELKRRGHRVTLITTSYFQTLADSAGIDFIAFKDREHFESMLRDPDLWHKTRAFKAVFVRGVLPLMEETYDLIAQQNEPGNTVVLAHSLCFGARIAHDKLGIPTATVHTAPSVMRTSYDVPKLPGLWMPNWLPRWMKQKIWEGGDRFILDPLLGPTVNEFRTRLGLETVSGIIREWWHSPQLTIGMWPDWYAPAQPDWPPQVRAVGFPLYDEADVTPLSADLDQWLQAGDKPIAFTPGSGMLQGADFFAVAVAACQRLNRRGLLLTRHAEQIPANLPPSIRHEPYAPFSTLLPRCAALVHHAGIGTTAQALRAGIPQLLMPMAHDQFDNAHRLQKLGVADWLPRHRFTPPRVADRLAKLLSDPAVSAACATVTNRFTASGSTIAKIADLAVQLSVSPAPVSV